MHAQNENFLMIEPFSEWIKFNLLGREYVGPSQDEVPKLRISEFRLGILRQVIVPICNGGSEVME